MDEWVNQVRSLIAGRRHNWNCSMDGDFQRVRNEMASRNMSNSSIYNNALAKIYGEGLEKRAETICSEIIRVIQLLGIFPEKDFLLEQLEKLIIEEENHLKSRAESKFISMTGYKAALQEIIHLLGLTRNKQISRFAPEANLFLLSLKKKSEVVTPVQMVNYNFPENTGNVSIGNGAVQNIRQQFIEVNKGGIIEKISDLQKAIEELNGKIDFEKSEIIDMIKDAKTEISKEKPNKTKIGWLLVGVGKIVGELGKIKPAYDGLKTILIPWGIQLP